MREIQNSPLKDVGLCSALSGTLSFQHGKTTICTIEEVASEKPHAAVCYPSPTVLIIICSRSQRVPSKDEHRLLLWTAPVLNSPSLFWLGPSFPSSFGLSVETRKLQWEQEGRPLCAHYSYFTSIIAASSSSSPCPPFPADGPTALISEVNNLWCSLWLGQAQC